MSQEDEGEGVQPANEIEITRLVELPQAQRVLPTTPEEIALVPLPAPHPLPMPPAGERHPLLVYAEASGWCSFCRKTEVRVAKIGHLEGVVFYGVCEICVDLMKRELSR